MPKKFTKRTQLVHGGTRRSQYGEVSEAIFLTQGFVYDTAGNNCLDPDALRPGQLWSKDLLTRSDYLNKWRATSFPMQDWHEISFDMRELFGVCVKGTIDKFKKYAETPPSRQRDEHLVGQTIFIDMACRIHAGAILQEAVRLEQEADT